MTRAATPSRALRGALAAASPFFFTACVVSPQPEPPLTEEPVIHLDLLSLGGVDGALALTGGAGAVTPGGSVLRALDLDVALPEAAVEVEADGRFTATIAGGLGHAYRLQAFAGERRSEPLDVTYTTGLTGEGGFTPVQAPLGGCLVLDPALEIGPLAAGASAPLTITDGCPEDVALAGFTLRLGSPAWAIAPAGPATVPAGGARAFTVTFTPGPGGDAADDVLFVALAAPQTGRRPLTLRGRAP